MISILINSIITLFLILIIANNPLTIRLCILIIAITISLIVGYIISSWYGFILFLIYVGGILVIFSYFISLSPNQSIQIPISILYFILSFFITLARRKNITVITNTFTLNQIQDLYTVKNIPILLFLAIILLYIIISVVKLCNLSKGPLRAFILQFSLFRTINLHLIREFFNCKCSF